MHEVDEGADIEVNQQISMSANGGLWFENVVDRLALMIDKDQFLDLVLKKFIKTFLRVDVAISEYLPKGKHGSFFCWQDGFCEVSKGMLLGIEEELFGFVGTYVLVVMAALAGAFHVSFVVVVDVFPAVAGVESAQIESVRVFDSLFEFVVCELDSAFFEGVLFELGLESGGSGMPSDERGVVLAEACEVGVVEGAVFKHAFEGLHLAVLKVLGSALANGFPLFGVEVLFQPNLSHFAFQYFFHFYCSRIPRLWRIIEAMTHREQPCPYRIVEDFGSGFGMGCVGGTLFYMLRGMWRAPKGGKFASGVDLVRQRAPVIGGSFAKWAGIFAITDCTLIAIRKKEDWINQVVAGGFTGGFLAFRAGWKHASRNALTGSILLGCICIVEQLVIKFSRNRELHQQAEMHNREIQKQRKEFAKMRPDLFVEKGQNLIPFTPATRFA